MNEREWVAYAARVIGDRLWKMVMVDGIGIDAASKSFLFFPLTHDKTRKILLTVSWNRHLSDNEKIEDEYRYAIGVCGDMVGSDVTEPVQLGDEHWSCGSPRCRRKHQSHGTAMRCPGRKRSMDEGRRAQAEKIRKLHISGHYQVKRILNEARTDDRES